MLVEKQELFLIALKSFKNNTVSLTSTISLSYLIYTILLAKT